MPKPTFETLTSYLRVLVGCLAKVGIFSDEPAESGALVLSVLRLSGRYFRLCGEDPLAALNAADSLAITMDKTSDYEAARALNERRRRGSCGMGGLRPAEAELPSLAREGSRSDVPAGHASVARYVATLLR
jgi:hypothetical protein